ncbi:NADH:ubiquinone oxidoreductase [Oceanibium sediminis]|uniref:NADH:ubiquinone oxidoreductase n=1 Tax=Oceanibium sediminis TaxID=2026339 RepID=UPI001E3DE07F|nr:NADH:ubiquinone oxidoreductase [Oceanibium sediminis]
MSDKTSPVPRTTALFAVWIIAGLASAMFVAMMIFFGDFGYTGPVFLGLLIWGGLGLVLMKGMVDLPAPPPVGAFDVKGGKSAEAPAPKAGEATSAAEKAGHAVGHAGAVVKEKAAELEAKVEEVAHAAKAAVTGANADEPGKPKLLSAARGGKPDDLKKIKGVGPKLEQVLNGLGVYHFDQIASWSDDEVAWVDENIEGFKGRVTRDGWVAQASELDKG